jgi:hypothetical protein
MRTVVFGVLLKTFSQTKDLPIGKVLSDTIDNIPLRPVDYGQANQEAVRAELKKVRAKGEAAITEEVRLLL